MFLIPTVLGTGNSLLASAHGGGGASRSAVSLVKALKERPSPLS